jgi:hypothetical protein
VVIINFNSVQASSNSQVSCIVFAVVTSDGWVVDIKNNNLTSCVIILLGSVKVKCVAERVGEPVAVPVEARGRVAEGAAEPLGWRSALAPLLLGGGLALLLLALAGEQPPLHLTDISLFYYSSSLHYRLSIILRIL